MKWKAGHRRGGAGSHSSLTFNHRKAAALGCEQNKKRSLRPFKEQYNLVLLPYRAARGEARHSGRVMRSLAAPESAGRCFLIRAGRASLRSIAARHRCPRPPLARHGQPLRAREGFPIGEANEADHPLMLLGKTRRSFHQLTPLESLTPDVNYHSGFRACLMTLVSPPPCAGQLRPPHQRGWSRSLLPAPASTDDGTTSTKGEKIITGTKRLGRAVPEPHSLSLLLMGDEQGHFRGPLECGTDSCFTS